MTRERKGRVAMLSEHANPMALLGSEDSGGQNVYVDEVARNVALLGYAVDVFCRRDSEESQEVNHWADGVRVVNLSAGPRTFLKKDAMWPYMPDFAKSFLDFCARERVDYDLLHGNFWMSGWVACELRARLRIPVVQIFHALGKTKRLHQGAADTSPADRDEAEYRVVRLSDRIIAQCPAEVEELTQLYDCDAGRIRVVPSAVNTQTFRPVPKGEARARLDLDPEAKWIVYVGRMLPRKGIDNLVVAFAKLAVKSAFPLRLLIVGGETADGNPEDTPEIARLMQMADTLGIRDRVTFTGKRPQKTLRDYYSAANVCVTTPWYEPFGLTPLEAMACGTPVIGSNVGGIKFTVLHGETGFLVPPRDADALAARIATVVGNPELEARLGLNAVQRVRRFFTWPKVAENTLAVYQEVLPAAKKAPADVTRARILRLPKAAPTLRPLPASAGVAAKARNPRPRGVS